MDELVKIIGNAITRDLIYIIGGSVISASSLYSFGLLNIPGEMPIGLQLLSAGIFYVLGYAAQEAFCLTGLVRTEHTATPPAVALWFYHRFTSKDWEPISIERHAAATLAIDSEKVRLSERAKQKLNRIVMLKQVGTTMSACGTVALVFLVPHAFCTGMPIDIALVIGTLAATPAFMAIAWIKRLVESVTRVRFAEDAEREKSTGKEAAA